MGDYRSDIDGLRALAILPVVLFHADVPPFGGGFVGVDVFFVISGFLITSVIAREVRDGKFSIIRFYERRARRILPALLAMMAATFAASSLILFPSEFRAVGQSLVATTVFASNVLFAARSQDYFVSNDSPLLHTWSLSVEEQFYLIWPLAVMFVRYRGWHLGWFIAAIIAVSLLAAIRATNVDPVHAYYALALATRGSWVLVAFSPRPGCPYCPE